MKFAVVALFSALLLAVSAQNCVDDCYLTFIPQTGCPGASDPNAPATPAYLQCVCQSYNSGPLADYLSCVAASCNSPGILSFFQAQCAAYPSGARKKRSQLTLTDKAAFCPEGKVACPVPYLKSSAEIITELSVKGSRTEMECVDPLYDIDSCGGCTSLGQGVSCADAQGVKATSCVRGKCQIFSCMRGYTLKTTSALTGAAERSCVAA